MEADSTDPAFVRLYHAEVEKALAAEYTQLQEMQAIQEDLRTSHDLVRDLPNRLSHPIFVPFGPHAFFPGALMRPNCPSKSIICWEYCRQFIFHVASWAGQGFNGSLELACIAASVPTPSQPGASAACRMRGLSWLQGICVCVQACLCVVLYVSLHICNFAREFVNVCFRACVCLCMNVHALALRLKTYVCLICLYNVWYNVWPVQQGSLDIVAF